LDLLDQLGLLRPQQRQHQLDQLRLECLVRLLDLWRQSRLSDQLRLKLHQ
jgi:hypothetical protein